MSIFFQSALTLCSVWGRAAFTHALALCPCLVFLPFRTNAYCFLRNCGNHAFQFVAFSLVSFIPPAG